MVSLQELIYKELPQEIKTTIVKNKDKYNAYAVVVEQLNDKILSGYKSRVKLTKQNLNTAKTLLMVYYDIINNPPKGKSDAIDAWLKFMKKYYPFYEETEEDTDKWTKFMWVLYWTYKRGYEQYYSLKHSSFTSDKFYEEFGVDKYDKRTRFEGYLYKVYKQLSQIPIQEFRDEGY
jgi:hypothetical protein